MYIEVIWRAPRSRAVPEAPCHRVAAAVMTPRPQVRQPWGDGRERPVPEYRREHERTRLANDVAIRVIQYRAMHGLSQANRAGRRGPPQPNLARLESAEHDPTTPPLSLVGAKGPAPRGVRTI